MPDAYDRPALTWDARGHTVERGFDLADRPVKVRVRGGAAGLDHVVEDYVYGDQDADRDAARLANALGRVVAVRDGAGEVRVTSYDPTGAVRESARRLRVALDDTPSWTGAEALEPDALPTSARADALGRPVWSRLADGTEERPRYHRGGALAAVELTTPDGAFSSTPVVDQLARDAHGRITGARLGAACEQTWAYDRDTGRLVAMDARRGTRWYQGLRYTYDPDGRITRALDLAQDGAGAILPSAVSARRDHRYDVHGRLLEATGRVHQALLPADYVPGTAGTINGARPVSLNDGGALERYTQRFSYDLSGNLTTMQHLGASASWSRTWWISGASNRSLEAVDANGNPVVDAEGHFDAGGNVLGLAHLRDLAWSWRGCLARAVTVARAAGPVDDDERYGYGADRVRVRKVATRLVVGGAEPVVETREVVYLGSQERVRVRRGETLVLERWTTHVHDGERRVAVVDRHVVDTLGAEVDAIGPARLRYHLTTPQGSTAVELDEVGRLISYEEYLPHGGSAFVAGDDAREVARRDVRYAGKERDRATGLHAYPQRYYAPWLGRWMSPDPIGIEGGVNLYEFVGGDPVGYVDPEGTDEKLADLPPVVERPVTPMPWTAPDGGGRSWTHDEQIAWYRENRSATRVRAFDSVSRDQQIAHLAKGYALVDHVDPTDNSSPAATLSPDEYNNWKLSRQSYLASQGARLIEFVPANPVKAAEPEVPAALPKSAAGIVLYMYSAFRGFDNTYVDFDALAGGAEALGAVSKFKEGIEAGAIARGQKVISYGWADPIAENYTRIEGGFQTVSGLAGMGVGAAITAIPIPGMQAVGLFVAALGADQVAAGVSKLATNKAYESNVYNLGNAIGGPEFARSFEGALNAATPMAAEYTAMRTLGLQWGRPKFVTDKAPQEQLTLPPAPAQPKVLEPGPTQPTQLALPPGPAQPKLLGPGPTPPAQLALPAGPAQPKLLGPGPTPPAQLALPAGPAQPKLLGPGPTPPAQPAGAGSISTTSGAVSSTPGSGSTTPTPIVVRGRIVRPAVASESEYWWRNKPGKMEDGNYVHAKLDEEGVLKMEIRANGPREQVRSGRAMFEDVFRHFGDKIKMFEANWVRTRNWDTNYRQYKAALGEGLTPAEAASSTWTGRQLQMRGMVPVEVVELDFAWISVIFK